MAVLIVSYDLNKEDKRPDIVSEVKKYAWARLSESSYAIDTSETQSQVYARFKKYIDDNDDLYVITLSQPWDGWGRRAVIEWLQARL